MDNNGFTQVENQYLASLYNNDSLSYESRIMFFLIRKIIGFHKTKDKVSYTEITNATGISRPRVVECIGRLEERGVIKIKRKAKCVNIITLVGSTEKRTTGSTEIRSKLVRKSVPSKKKTKDEPSASYFGKYEPQVEKKTLQELQAELGDEYE